MIRSRWKARQWTFLAVWAGWCEVVAVVHGGWMPQLALLGGVIGVLWQTKAWPFHVDRGERAPRSTAPASED